MEWDVLSTQCCLCINLRRNLLDQRVTADLTLVSTTVHHVPTMEREERNGKKASWKVLIARCELMTIHTWAVNLKEQ